MGEIRFSHFIAELALNPDMLERYKKDPEAVMAAAGLSAGEKGVLRTGKFSVICDFLGDTGPRPITMSEVIGPGGPPKP